MATPRRGRGGAATPNRPQLGGFRPIYEDFTPASKWSQDDDTFILTIQVPGKTSTTSLFLNNIMPKATVDGCGHRSWCQATNVLLGPSRFTPLARRSRKIDTILRKSVIYIYLVSTVGFMKEQLKVSTEDRNIIRVGGERLIANNKWSRFEEDFQVPDNSELSSVRAKHDRGTLTITVPRKNIAAARTPAKETLNPPTKSKEQVLPPKTKSPREPETDHHGRDRVTPAISPITDDRSSEPAQGIQKTSGDHPRIKFGQQEDEQKSHIEKEKSPELTEKPAARKRIVDDKSLELLGTKRTSEDYPGTRTEDEKKSYVGKKGIQETKEKHILPGTVPWKDNVGKSEKISKERHPQIAKSSATDDSPDHGALKMGLKKYEKKGVKGIGELNEERQLLVNMGAALLIIVGLSAYVAYNFASQNAKH